MGVGYVGLPMAIALASAIKKGKYIFNVYGYDRDINRIKTLRGKSAKRVLPFQSNDFSLKNKFINSCKKNKIIFTDNFQKITNMDIILISIGFSFEKNQLFKNIIEVMENTVKIIKKKTILIIETTLPPGTFEKILVPHIKQVLRKRNLKLSDIYLAYSFERIMPGKKYYDSIVNNYRCFSGINEASTKRAETFLKSFINYKKFPLTKMKSITECETVKILENSYRASNIALIDEWVKYANFLKIDLLNVIKAIKIRPTHSNIMMPGLGVGGYCLPKDALFAKKSASIILKKKLSFPFIDLASKTNNLMPNSSLEFVEENIKSFKNKKILILGVSYKNDVGDIRNSPTIYLYKKLKKKGSIITLHDPLINEKNIFSKKLPDFKKFHFILLCVKHSNYLKLKFSNFSKKPIYFDLNNVLNQNQIHSMKKKKFKLFILGRHGF